jgi:hypothetical protein
MTDNYTKTVLTVIAAALVFMIAKSEITPAQADTLCNGQTIPVQIVGTVNTFELKHGGEELK